MDIALVACLFLTVLALGGRHEAGLLAYVVAIAVATLATVIGAVSEGRPLKLPRLATGIALAAIAVVAIQLVPLPTAWLSIVAPGHADLLPLWGEGSWLGRWATVSLAPAETAEGLALLIAHCLLFFVVRERIRTENHIRQLLAWVAGCAVLVVGLVVLQKIVPSDRFLWIYDYPNSSFASAVKGTFTNRNHLAHFLNFGAAALLALLAKDELSQTSRSSPRKESKFLRRAAVLTALILVLTVLLASQSRGGLIALLTATSVGALFRWLAGRFALADTVTVVVVGLAVLGGLSFFGYGKVSSRLDDLVSGQIEELDSGGGRRFIWAANARAIAANPWLGHGAGSHRYVYPCYADRGSNKEYTHAESGYLQIGTENGLAGLVVLALAFATISATLFRGAINAKTASRTAIWSALGAGIGASFSHSVVDFVWYVPALGGLVVAFASCAYRLAEMQSTVGYESAPEKDCTQPNLLAWTDWIWLGGGVAATCFAVTTLVHPAAGGVYWDRYIRVSKTIRLLEAKQFDANNGGPSDPQLAATIDKSLVRSVESLKKVVTWDALNARAHARLAGRMLQEFERLNANGNNPMSIAMIQGAVESGGFQTDDEVREWLVRAFGHDAVMLAWARQHALTAVRLCPLQGESYLQLASLLFLEHGPTSPVEFLDQAVLLRPYDGRVLFEAGRQRHLAGDIKGAFELYRASIRLPGSHRKRLVSALSRVLPAADFLAELSPDSASTDLMLTVYREVGTDNDLETIAEYSEAELVSELASLSPYDAASRWRQLSIINRTLGRSSAALECAKRAYELLPHDFWVRHELALALNAAELYADADPHFRWCLARRPDLRYLQEALKLATKRRSIHGAVTAIPATSKTQTR